MNMNSRGGSGATHATRARAGDSRHLLCVNTRPILSSAPNQSDMVIWAGEVGEYSIQASASSSASMFTGKC